MKKSLLKILAVVVALVGVVCLASPALVWAEDEESQTKTGNSLRLTPTSAQLKLTAGEVLEGSMSGCQSGSRETCSVDIQNTGNNTFTYRVYATPYVVTTTDEGNGVAFEGGGDNVLTQIARWITVKGADGKYAEEATFQIEPGKTQTVEYRVTVPESIPGGSQYAVLWAEIQGDSDQADGVVTLGRVGEVIIGRSSGDTVETAELKEISMTSFSFGGSLTAAAKLSNTGNTDFVLKYSYKVKTLFGKEVFTQSKAETAFPGADYKVNIDWENPPLLGVFLATFEVSGANVSESITKLVMVMPVWVMILVILLLTIVVVWIIIIIRKRKEHKVRKLV